MLEIFCSPQDFNICLEKSGLRYLFGQKRKRNEVVVIYIEELPESEPKRAKSI